MSKNKLGRNIQIKVEEVKSGNWYSSVSVVTGLRDESPRNHGSISGMGKIFFFFGFI
jgi:hypothetical protein